MSKPRARRATAAPMRPRPTMPSVAPATSRPRNGPSDHGRAPAPGAHELVALDEPAPRREHQREREIRRRRVEHARRVRHRDAARTARVDVEPVVADAVVRDEPQRREAGRASIGLVGDDQRLDVVARLSSGPTSTSPSSSNAGPGYRRVARTFKPRVSMPTTEPMRVHARGTAAGGRLRPDCRRYRLEAAVGPRPRSGTTTRFRRTRGPWTRRHFALELERRARAVPQELAQGRGRSRRHPLV